MRFGVLVIALASTLAACHGPKAAGPAWPAASTTADDGGESIEPHPTSVAAAVETSTEEDDEKPAAASEDTKPAAAAATPDAPAAATPADSPQGEVIISDEIIIEIDE